MSVSVNHELSIKEGFEGGLDALLKKDNIISKRTIYRYDRDGNVFGREIDDVLDLALCDMELAYEDIDKDYMKMHDCACKKGYSDYEERLQSKFSRGWEIDPDGDEGDFRRKWDKRVYDCLPLEIVMLSSNEVRWHRNYTYDDRPAIAISKRYPEYTFEYTIYCEGRIVGHCLLKNGMTTLDLLAE